jgi:hypothetical protein
MAELHELLAVEKDLATKAKQSIQSAIKGFAHEQIFVGREKVYRAYEDDALPEEPETALMAFTVSGQLDLVLNDIGRWVDAVVAKDISNTMADASIEIDGEEDILNLGPLPATALLDLESRLTLVLGVFKDIPTLDPKEEWARDEDLKMGDYRSSPRVTYRTQKRMITHVEYDATPEHPAQVQTFTQDERVGEYITTLTSGMWPLAKKRAAIVRIETLIAAVKQARQRANRHRVDSARVWDRIQAYILGE